MGTTADIERHKRREEDRSLGTTSASLIGFYQFGLTVSRLLVSEDFNLSCRAAGGVSRYHWNPLDGNKGVEPRKKVSESLRVLHFCLSGLLRDNVQDIYIYTHTHD